MSDITSISIIVPAYNEQDSLETLVAEIACAVGPLNLGIEVIFVDDGSTDSTSDVLDRLCQSDDRIKTISFRRNFGKAAALDAGFAAATGDVIFTMDADLQDDPAEIPRFLEALNSGLDVVSGWKHVRHDPIDKTLPSKVFNGIVSRLSGVRLNDFNCGFKAYRADAVRGLRLYGELHRFIPVILHWRGYEVGEIAVNHRARQFGESKYGVGRLFKGALDFMAVMLNTRFATRPLHVFGGAGFVFGGLGLAILMYLTAVWFSGAGPIGDRPLLLLGILMVMTSFQFVTIGLLGEFIQNKDANGQRRYTVKSVQNLQFQRRRTDRLVDDLYTTVARMKEAQAQWTPPQFVMTPQNDTSASMKTKTPSTG